MDPIESAGEVSSAPRRQKSGAQRLRQRKKRHASTSAKTPYLIGALLVIFAAGVFFSRQGRVFVAHLYDPVVIIDMVS